MCCLALSRVNTTPFCGRVPSLKLKLTNHAAKTGDCSNEESQPKEDSLWKDLLKKRTGKLHFITKLYFKI